MTRPTATAVALARLYDLDLVDDPGDLDLYLAMAARTGGPILELGSGTGRLAVPVAAAGHEVTGVDIDRAMIDRAVARAEAAWVTTRIAVPSESDAPDADAPPTPGRVTFVEADMLGLRLAGAGTYRLGYIALNSLMLLSSRSAQRGAIRTLAEHLAPGGVAVIDVWLPDAEDLARFDGRLVLEYPRADPDTGRVVTKIASAVHDAATQTIRLVAIYEEGDPGEPPARWVREDRLRLVGADELRGFAEDAGLYVETLAGGYDLEPLGPGSERAVLVAVRP